ncbi:MAG: SusC/RagA family TonB-linked outer membrane protein [Paludibacter sp.]|nr:SusC/RagA family TonB-linked outer membrane protein [Paludibacter sp.]
MHNVIYNRIKTGYFTLIFLWMLFAPVFTIAQESGTDNSPVFSGKIVDQYGNQIKGVEIAIKKGNILTLSHPDYLYKEVKLKGELISEENLTIVMTDKYLKNPEIVDRPYGTVDKESFLGSASTIYTDQLSSTLSSTIIPAFAGRFSGLNTQQYAGSKSNLTSGSAGLALDGWIPVFGAGNYSDNSQFTLRSRQNSPVVMVDGVQRELFSLDPEAIESVSIQKDALSSMLLGMRSSRGVLVITTKKPVAQGFQLSFTGKYGIQEAVNTPKPLSAYQYAYLLNEALQNDGKTPAYTYTDFDAFRNGTNPFTHSNINWYDQVMKKQASIQSYNLNVSGGGKVAQYFVNLEYMTEDGLFRTSLANSYNTNSKYERYLITSKININVTDEFKAGVTVIGRIEDGNQQGARSSNILHAIYTTPNGAYPIYNPNGSFGGNVSFPNNLWSQAVNSGYATDNARDALANLNLSYDFGKWVKGLSAKAIGSVSTQSRSALSRAKQSITYEYIPGETGEDPTYDPFGSTITQSNDFIPVSNYQYMYGQFGLDYGTTIGKHGIDASVFADVRQVLTNYNLPDQPTNLYAQGKYNYAKKYFVEAAVNRSYYNGYAPGKRWGTFYAFGLGWNVSKEDFLKDLKWLDLWKVRGVYGKTGSGIDNAGYYTWRQSFSGVSVSEYSYPQGYSRGGFQLAVLENSPLANVNLTWEKAYKMNIGTDVELFNKRLHFTADYYYDKYFDVLQSRGKSIELIGISYPAENLGEYSVQGLELSFTYQHHIGKFNYFITANWNRESTKLLFMDEQFVAKSQDYNRRTGKPLSAQFGLVADGFFSSQQEIESSPVVEGYTIRPGDVKYKDLNTDGVIDQYDQQMISGDKPLSYFGLNLGFEYCGFDFSVLFQGVYNRDLYLGDPVLMAGFQTIGQAYGQAYEHMMNRWTPETAATATFPRLTAGGNPYNTNPNYLATSLWVRSGNYIRLKNLSIGYTLPEAFSRSFLGGVKVKVFVAGQNLLTQSACNLVDPEVTNFTNSPLLRGFNTGINIKF